MTQPAQKPGRSKQDYATPTVLLDPVKRRLGITAFAFDLAADASNAVAEKWYSKAQNSLLQDWTRTVAPGAWMWLNPEFAEIGPWAKKCAESGQKIAFLVPAAVGSNWFRDYVDGKALVLFLNGRIPFMPDKPNWGYPKDCLLALYGLSAGYEVWNWRRP